MERIHALWDELARGGRARVLDCFTQARVAEETVGVYQEVLTPP